MKFTLPLTLFLLLFVFLAIGLRYDPRLVPSPLIGGAAPPFQLARLDRPDETFSMDQLRGQVLLLNTWASWCISCRQEHSTLVELSQTHVVPIYGLNYKDDLGSALDWLQQFGNPYVLSVQDRDGRVGIDYGVYGI